MVYKAKRNSLFTLYKYSLDLKTGFNSVNISTLYLVNKLYIKVLCWHGGKQHGSSEQEWIATHKGFLD